MSLHYLVSIEQPHTHYVQVRLTAPLDSTREILDFFLPVWSPGSYMVREYSRHVRSVRALSSRGETLYVEQTKKNRWSVSWPKDLPRSKSEQITLHYEVYAHEISVRTSYIDSTHAFLHGPTYLMGLEHLAPMPHTLELRFPPLWSKISTGLEDISPTREKFVFKADHYDELLDCPIEIGCQETDGFMCKGRPHELAFFGHTLIHKQNIKADIHKIVDTVSSHFGSELPYKRYVFITHFATNLYGGLEHGNSTALHFDGATLNDRKSYLHWLALVAHEYFHTWNIKRIRPKELGPFNYQQEAMTPLLWLAEGLTSFMDDLLVYRAGLMTLEEYAEVIKNNVDKYLNIPGRKFHSAEDSSFNAWIKLYRPDENSNNSSVSYYLKGGLVFMMLHLRLREKGKSINHLLELLWRDYLAQPQRGVTREDVLAMVKSLAGDKVAEEFMHMMTNTESIDFESALKKVGFEMVWDSPENAYLGMSARIQESRVYVDSVVLDGPAFRSGLNAGDELIAINNLRILREQYDKFEKHLMPDTLYQIVVNRMGRLLTIEVTTGRKPKNLKEIKVVNQDLAAATFK
jgi:predicted metalloprotease with PDZ domain